MTDLARQAPSQPLDIDLGPARETAARWVADAVVPCAAIGVIDASGRFRCDFVPGGEGTIDLRSVFFLASLTKGIVATAFMRYVDEARVDLHAPMERYLSTLAGTDAGAVTAWQVLDPHLGLAGHAGPVDAPGASHLWAGAGLRAGGALRDGAGHGLPLQLGRLHAPGGSHVHAQRRPAR